MTRDNHEGTPFQASLVPSCGGFLNPPVLPIITRSFKPALHSDHSFCRVFHTTVFEDEGEGDVAAVETAILDGHDGRHKGHARCIQLSS